MEKLNIIARCTSPKQRMTRLFETQLILRTDGLYDVRRYYPEDDAYDYGSYDLTDEQAWREFGRRVANQLSYGPGTWEVIQNGISREVADA